MKLAVIVSTALSIILVAGVIVAYASQGSVSTATHIVSFTTTTTLISAEISTSVSSGTATVTVYENANVVGNCRGVWYYLSDIETEYANGTVVSPSVVSYNTTYTSSSFANYTSALVVTSTSTDYGYAPSSAWLVSVCTYTR